MKHVVKLRKQLNKVDDLLADYYTAVIDYRNCSIRKFEGKCEACEEDVVGWRENVAKQMDKVAFTLDSWEF